MNAWVVTSLHSSLRSFAVSVIVKFKPDFTSVIRIYLQRAVFCHCAWQFQPAAGVEGTRTARVRMIVR